jgi:integrase
MANITTRTARERLKPRREPYWLKLGPGRALGFRAGSNTWIARLRGADGKQSYHALSDLETGAGTEAGYNVAKTAAERWLNLASGTGHRQVRRGTVRTALAAYLWQLRQIGRRRAAVTAAALFKLAVDEGFGTLKLESVAREDVEAWRRRLQRKGRQNRSVNRYTRQVIGALNMAVEKLGHTGNTAAWRDMDSLTDDVEESGEAAVSLTPEQRERLIGKSPKALAALLRALEHTGARPSEIAVATVADYDARTGTLTLRSRKGRPAKLKARGVMLSSAGATFFRLQSRGKLPGAPLITNAHDGGHWTRTEWARGIRVAATLANVNVKPKQRIPDGVCAYSFRHARISELLQVYGVDPLTVAQQTGTSMAMMERYYFRFISNSMRAKLDGLKAK